MREKFRDKIRDEFTKQLNDIGVTAIVSDRKRSEEKVGNRVMRRSLGIIDLPDEDGPIKWINIIKQDRTDKQPPRWWFYFGAPTDKPLPKSRSVNIKTKRKKSFPLFGKIIGVTWKGQDRNHGLANKLSNDTETDNLAIGVGNIRVKTLHEEFSGWSIEIDRKFNLTRENWKSLKRVAEISIDSIAYF